MTEQDLTFVRLTDDGRKLVLVGADGEEFRVVVDEQLRSAVRSAPRYGRLEKTMESTLRPRDIQARIRAGDSPENVAVAAQTTVERIMGFATPVLAERAHIAERAQRASVRRKGNEGPSRILGDAVVDRLRSVNVDPESVEWDAWRREDGRWTLIADFGVSDAPRHAEFVFDMPGRYVVPEDDQARWLIGETAATAPEQAAGLRRLAAVADEELPLGEDAIGMVSLQVPAQQHPPQHTQQHPHPAPADPAAVTGDGDWMATQATERPAPPTGLPSYDDPEPAPEQAPTPQPEAPAEQPAETPAAAEEQPARKTARKGRGRASVPSWDEIMFGGGRTE